MVFSDRTKDFFNAVAAICCGVIFIIFSCMLVSNMIVFLIMSVCGIDPEAGIPTAMYVLDVVLCVYFTGLAGYLVGIVSKGKEYRNSFIAGLIYLVLYIILEIRAPESVKWYLYACGIKVIPACLAGTYVYINFFKMKSNDDDFVADQLTAR